jgi:hypothetical protein
MMHPSAAPPLKKEPHFFDVNYSKGLLWYRRNFPSVFFRLVRKMEDKKVITGEATPYYIFHPNVPRRVAQLLPRVKLIAMLRNPVDRAYSHYQSEKRFGTELLSFEEAIVREDERIRGEKEKILADETYVSEKYRAFSYCSRGIYVDQLCNWAKFFPIDKMLMLKSEDFFLEPAAVFSRTLDYLGLDDWQPKEFIKFKAPHLREYTQYEGGNYPPMNSKTRAWLVEYFAPFNRELYKFLNVNYHWDETDT